MFELNCISIVKKPVLFAKVSFWHVSNSTFETIVHAPLAGFGTYTDRSVDLPSPLFSRVVEDAELYNLKNTSDYFPNGI